MATDANPHQCQRTELLHFTEKPSLRRSSSHGFANVAKNTNLAIRKKKLSSVTMIMVQMCFLVVLKLVAENVDVLVDVMRDGCSRHTAIRSECNCTRHEEPSNAEKGRDSLPNSGYFRNMHFVCPDGPPPRCAIIGSGRWQKHHSQNTNDTMGAAGTFKN